MAEVLSAFREVWVGGGSPRGRRQLAFFRRVHGVSWTTSGHTSRGLHVVPRWFPEGSPILVLRVGGHRRRERAHQVCRAQLAPDLDTRELVNLRVCGEPFALVPRLYRPLSVRVGTNVRAARLVRLHENQDRATLRPSSDNESLGA